MKHIFNQLVLCTVLFFAACGGGEENGGGGGQEQPDEQALSLSISGLIESYTSASVKIVTTGATSYGYVINHASETDNSITAEQIFTSGIVGTCSKTGATTFSVRDLLDNSDYVLYVAVKSAQDEYSAVATRTFKTKALPEFAVVNKTQTEVMVSVRIPEAVPSTSVVKWAVTDLANYNYAGGDESQLQWLNRNEAIYENYFTQRLDLTINEDNRTFTKGDVQYSHYEPIMPGQPVILLLAEFAEGSHSEYGAGYYSPFYGQHNSAGYYRKELIVTSKPTSISSKPTVNLDLRPSGKGTIKITVPTDIVNANYLILDSEQYSSMLQLLGNNDSYMQWFITTPLAATLYGVKSTDKSLTIDASTLNLKQGEDYKLVITAFGNAEGTRQSYLMTNFSLPAPAPAAANNIVIAHRGGSKEAGVPDNSIASLKYAISLGCYSSETDIYWTKDNNVVVAHADSNCKINGLYPWESTLEQIQSAGKLSNGETIPSLEDYIRAAMNAKGSCTKICLDIKAITKPTMHHDEAVKACERACEIIADMEAQNYCIFICSGYTDIVKHCAKYANAVGVEIGAMGNSSASQYKNWGYTWHNRNIVDYDASESTINGYINAGLEVSVYTVDNDTNWSVIAPYVHRLKGITTNYPAWMLKK